MSTKMIKPSPAQTRLSNAIERAILSTPKPNLERACGSLVESATSDIQDQLLLAMGVMGLVAPPMFRERQVELHEAFELRRQRQRAGIARARAQGNGPEEQDELEDIYNV